MDGPDASASSVVTSRWGRRLIVALVVLGLIVVYVPEVLTGTFSGPRPFFRVVALVVALGVWGWIIRRIGGNAPWVPVAVYVPVALALWFTVLPYLQAQDVVDDPFPVVAGATPGGDAISPPDRDTSETSVTSGPPASIVDTDTASTTTETTAVATPVATHRGSFRGLTGHTGEGQATLYDLPDGQRVLRLEEFEAGPGPKLEVWLVPGVDQTWTGGGTFLGDVRGRGNVNYDVPADLSVDGPWTVLVWCETFAVEVANATITAA